MDQVEHLYQAMFDFHTGKCGIEKVMEIMKGAGYDTAQGNLTKYIHYQTDHFRHSSLFLLGTFL